MDKEHTCCFTGHRPARLPWGTREEDPRCRALKERLAAALEEEYQAGSRHFICGMARGTDLYFAEAVLALRDRLPGITLECARPCESQAQAWPREEQARYASILDRADFETLVQQHYDRGCMARRNRYMVDHAARLLAIYDGQPRGGTAQTVLYALRKGLAINILPVCKESTP